MRLLIVEEALKDRRGHWYEYNRAIVAEARRSAEVTVLAHRDLQPTIAAELGATPFFPATSWDGVYNDPSPWKRYLGILRHNLLVARHMERFFREAGRFDVVLVPTVVLYHWLAWRWLAWRGRGRWFGKLVLTTRNNAGEYDPATRGYVFSASARVLRRIVASFRGPVRRGEVELASDSSVIAAQYASLCGVPFTVYPHPVDDDSPQRGVRGTTSPITFGALGPPRFEKGSDLVLEAMRLFRAGGGDSRLLLQWTGACDDSKGKRVEPGPEIASDPAVTLITTDLTTTEYQRRLDECDVVLLPYRRAQYHARLSGVAVEAFRKGIPCICFTDTWVADTMAEFGGGIAAREESARSLADAMNAMREDFTQYATRALDQSEAARRHFSPASFIEQLTATREDPARMNDSGHQSLLIYCPAASGGIAEHAHYQARALREMGIAVEVMASQDYLQGRAVPYPVARRLPTAPAGGKGLARRLRHAAWLCICPWMLATHVLHRKPSGILLASFSEYLSPFWIWPHLALRRVLRVRYGANLHDPVRDFQLGPKWWHALSVALAYRCLDFVILHQARPGPGVVPAGIEIHEAPVGVYDLAELSSGDAPIPVRGIPEGVPVLVCFGHIRDNKNIDLLIRALPAFPELHLVVAGPPPSTGQRPVETYAALARETGVMDRVHIAAGFVADGDLAAYFHRATWIAVTYASTFLSQSGVLNIAARARKQVLASSGPSPMQAAVEGYGLGVFVEPDSLPAVVGGLRRLMDNPPEPDWAGYEAHASWATNAKVIMAASGISAGERQQA